MPTSPRSSPCKTLTGPGLQRRPGQPLPHAGTYGGQPASCLYADARRKRARLSRPQENLPAGTKRILNTIVSNQEALLNAQGHAARDGERRCQDNFNLKDDNRKLRERMLELERPGEYQRREETRKERLESRLRAVEGTVGALQQQLAQLVQLYRTQSKRGGWFG